MAEDFKAGFVRQRRSLILLSLLLSIVVWFGIDGTVVRLGPVGGTGMSVNLHDQRYIYWGMYGAWVWFFVRYIQYFLQVRESALTALRADQWPVVEPKVKPLLREKAKEQLRAKVVEEHPNATNIEIIEFRGPDDLTRDNRKSISGRYSSSAIVDTRPNKLGRMSEHVIIEGAELRKFLLKTTWKKTLLHPYVFEYILPLFLGVAPLIILIWRWREVFCKSGA